MTETLLAVLGPLIIIGTLLALRAMYSLWRDRQDERRVPREDGSSPWLLTRVVILCAGATAVGLWLSILSLARMLGHQFPWSPPVSYVLGLIVTLLPSYVAWEFHRRANR